MESVIKQEFPVITEAQESAVRRMLDDLAMERRSFPTEGLQLKMMLREYDVDEYAHAYPVMRYYYLANRYVDEIKQIARTPGDTLRNLLDSPPEHSEWMGALHQVQLVNSQDSSDRMIVTTPTIPREYELIELPQHQEPMRVLSVVYEMARDYRATTSSETIHDVFQWFTTGRRNHRQSRGDNITSTFPTLCGA